MNNYSIYNSTNSSSEQVLATLLKEYTPSSKLFASCAQDKNGDVLKNRITIPQKVEPDQGKKKILENWLSYYTPSTELFAPHTQSNKVFENRTVIPQKVEPDQGKKKILKNWLSQYIPSTELFAPCVQSNKVLENRTMIPQKVEPIQSKDPILENWLSHYTPSTELFTKQSPNQEVDNTSVPVNEKAEIQSPKIEIQPQIKFSSQRDFITSPNGLNMRIQNVRGDGNCLLHAFMYPLRKSMGQDAPDFIQRDDGNACRKALVQFAESDSLHLGYILNLKKDDISAHEMAELHTPRAYLSASGIIGNLMAEYSGKPVVEFNENVGPGTCTIVFGSGHAYSFVGSEKISNEKDLLTAIKKSLLASYCSLLKDKEIILTNTKESLSGTTGREDIINKISHLLSLIKAQQRLSNFLLAKGDGLLRDVREKMMRDDRQEIEKLESELIPLLNAQGYDQCSSLLQNIQRKNKILDINYKNRSEWIGLYVSGKGKSAHYQAIVSK